MAIRRFSPPRQILTAVLTLALTFGPGFAAPTAAQEGRSAMRGTLFETDGENELAGGRVTAVNVRTGKQYSSNITGRNGAYEIKGLPAGTYDVAIEASGRLYVADTLVDLHEGDVVSADYAVLPLKPANRVIAGMPAPKGSAVVVGGPEQPVARSFWRSPNGIFLLSVLGVGAALAISGDGDGDASPSSP